VVKLEVTDLRNEKKKKKQNWPGADQSMMSIF
jgi:hypothetical protein